MNANSFLEYSLKYDFSLPHGIHHTDQLKAEWERGRPNRCESGCQNSWTSSRGLQVGEIHRPPPSCLSKECRASGKVGQDPRIVAKILNTIRAFRPMWSMNGWSRGKHEAYHIGELFWSPCLALDETFLLPKSMWLWGSSRIFSLSLYFSYNTHHTVLWKYSSPLTSL